MVSRCEFHTGSGVWAYETASLRFKGDYVLAPRQHDPAERNHVQLRNGVANDGKSLLPNCAVGGNVVGRVDITLIDLTFWNELVNIDGARAFDLDGLYFLILNNHVLALCDLIAAHHVVPRDDLAGLRIDILLFQSVARCPVDPIETHFFAERRGRIERNGARDQRKPKIALPVRTRRHWILLNNTRRANYTANFSKCLRPLSGGAGAGRDLLRLSFICAIVVSKPAPDSDDPVCVQLGNI